LLRVALDSFGVGLSPLKSLQQLSTSALEYCTLQVNLLQVSQDILAANSLNSWRLHGNQIVELSILDLVLRGPAMGQNLLALL